MRPLAEIESAISGLSATPDIQLAIDELLQLSEEVIEHWVTARGEVPTGETREGFRLLALHRQGATGDPSFNACRETCRELAYYYNLITLDALHAETNQRLVMMAMVVRHLFLFISGKMQDAQLGEFCCSSRPLRANVN